MFETFLYLHLTGAALMGVLGIWAVVEVVRRDSTKLALIAKLLAAGLLYQVISGSALGFVKQGTLLAFCSRIGLYLFIILAIEVLIFVRMKAQSGEFPMRFVTRMCTVSVLTGLAAVVIIYT